MKEVRKTIIMVLCLLLGCATIFANGQKEKSNSGSKERVRLVISLDNMLNAVSQVKALEEVQKMEKYSNVDFVILDKDAEYETTMPISVAGGQQLDIVGIFNPIQQSKFAQSDTIIPLDDIIAENGIDWDKEFGPYVTNSKVDGKIVMVPHGVTTWVLYYNKSIFDKAGVSYPDANIPMTWTEYSELAAKLTSGSGNDKVYGALHVNWPMFWYGEAIMAQHGGESFYNEKGLSNIEHPSFAKALKRTFNMQHVDKSVPTYADIAISKTGPQAFMGGKYGMIMQGGWLLDWAADKATYPRDWELGIAPMPVDEGRERKSWGVVNGYAIAQSSKYPELAFEVMIDLSRLNAKYTTSTIDANQTVVQENLYIEMGRMLGAEGITTEVMMHHFADPTIKFYSEKITGPNNVAYETVCNEEVEKFFVEAQTLEETIANIKKRGDAAIQKK